MPNNLKHYDANQVLRSVFDVDRNTLRVSVVDGSTGDGSGFEVIITHTDDSIRIGDGTNYITSTTIGPKVGFDVNVINDLDAANDNVAIHDADGDELSINPDGSINVQGAINAGHAGLSEYNEVTAVASGIETDVVSLTAGVGVRTFIQKVCGSGDNIAKYRVKVNGTEIDMKRTYFGGDLNTDFSYDGELNSGLELDPGDILLLTVVHQRPNVGDFNGKIQYLEVT